MTLCTEDIYLIRAPDSKADPKVRHFLDWLTCEAGNESRFQESSFRASGWLVRCLRRDACCAAFKIKPFRAARDQGPSGSISYSVPSVDVEASKCLSYPDALAKVHSGRMGVQPPPRNHPPVPSDPVRINVKRAEDVAYWSKEFGCTPREVFDAVKYAGVVAEDLRRILTRRR